jgi:hypothetical protein
MRLTRSETTPLISYLDAKNKRDLPVYHTECPLGRPSVSDDPLVFSKGGGISKKTNPLPPLFAISPLLFPHTLAHAPTRDRSPPLASRSDQRQSRRPQPRRGHTESSEAGVVSAAVIKTLQKQGCRILPKTPPPPPGRWSSVARWACALPAFGVLSPVRRPQHALVNQA